MTLIPSRASCQADRDAKEHYVEKKKQSGREEDARWSMR